MIDSDIDSVGQHARGCTVPRRLMSLFGVLQEKWSLQILYVLGAGQLGFNDIGRSAGGVNPGTLANRLARLEDVGLITKTVISAMPPRTLYELTDAGRAVGPVLEAAETWSREHPLGIDVAPNLPGS